MAYLQRRYIKKQHTLASDAATYTVDLPASNVLSALEVHLAWTNGTTYNQVRSLATEIDKLEVIANGSMEIVSVTGYELAKLAHLLLGRSLMGARNQGPSAVQSVMLPLLFGRWIGDPNYYLNCAAFTSLELKITYSPTISATVGYATGTGVLDVIGYMYMGGAPGMQAGYLKTSRKKNFSSAASGDEVVELPLGHPYRLVAVTAYEAAIADGVDVTEYQLRLNDGEVFPSVGRWTDQQKDNQFRLGIDPGEGGIAFLTSADTLESECGALLDGNVQCAFAYGAGADFPIYNLLSAAGGLITLSGQLVEGSATYAAAAVDTVDRTLRWGARGHGVGNAIILPTYDLYDPELWLPSREYDSVDLILTQGGAGADVSVLLQEVLPPVA